MFENYIEMAVFKITMKHEFNILKLVSFFVLRYTKIGIKLATSSICNIDNFPISFLNMLSQNPFIS